MPFIGFSQPITDYKYDFNWISGIDTLGNPQFNPNLFDNCLHFDFNGDTLGITMELGYANFKYTSATISDREGKLQFFTNGCHVFSHNYKIMDNGEKINDPVILYDQCNGIDYTGYSAAQGAIILPRNGSDSIYDLITQEWKVQNDNKILMQYLHHSVIDMSINNGLGKIIEKNTVILNDSMGSILTAVRHENNKSWWLITKKENSTKYFIFLFDSAGFGGLHTQDIGVFDKGNDASGNGVAFSPNGTKYAHYEPRQGLFLYNFDRKYGTLSNFRFVNIVGNEKDTLQSGYICFSQNSRFIYIAEGSNLWQVDTDIDSLKNGIEKVAESDFKNNPNTVFYTTYGMPTLGPDCRIYIGMYGAQPWINVINNPDEKGKACNVVSAKTKLPMWQWPAFPNMINYRLGTGQPTCDSNKIVLTADNFIIMPVNGPLLVYPNPFHDEFTVQLIGENTKKRNINLIGIDGRIIAQYILPNGQNKLIINTNPLMSGLYFIRMISDDGIKIQKLIKQ